MFYMFRAILCLNLYLINQKPIKMKFFKICSLLFLFAFLTSCEKNLFENGHLPNKDSENPAKNFQDEMIVLGNQLQNPYSVENMQMAYNIIKRRYGDAIPNITVDTTHHYIKFSPKNEEEFIDLVSDTSMNLFTYPLDYEILSVGGLYYQDPSIPDSLPTFQYASIEAGYTPHTQVRYENLENLCIPEITKYYTQNLNDSIIRLWVDVALLMTDNYEEDTSHTKSTLEDSYHPCGKITVQDDIVGDFIPIENVEVRARRWFTVYTARTDETGEFYMPNTFKRPCNYSLVWSTFRYYITNGIWFPAVYNGPKQKENWDLDISDNGKSFRFATLFRAANRYFEKTIGGLKRPNVWTKLKIAYVDDKGSGINWGNNWQTFIFGLAGLPNIIVWGKYSDYDVYKPSDVLFSTTIHELGHASHISLLSEFQYIQVDPIIYESWASAVEWYITKVEYNELNVTEYDDPTIPNNDENNKQYWCLPFYNDDNKIYTSLFIDLFDDYNQALRRGVMPYNRCPNGGTFDGCNCFVVQPPYLEEVYLENYTFYYTPQNCCDCPIPGTYYNGQTCYVLAVPATSIPFLRGGSGYIYPAGNQDYPYDQVTGYTMTAIENDILKHSYGLSSLNENLKAHLPQGMTERHIDVFMNFFFNL